MLLAFIEGKKFNTNNNNNGIVIIIIIITAAQCNNNNIMSCKNQIRTQNCAITAMRNSDNRANYAIIGNV